MNGAMVFFEIPAKDFRRAVNFYETVLGVKLSVMESEAEKMAFFPEVDGKCPGAVSAAEGFEPSPGGALLSFAVADMEDAADRIASLDGECVTPKTAIEGKGFFSVHTDSEGNRIGLYSRR